MSRLARAIEILETIHKHFDHEGQGVLYSDAQILEDDTSIKDAIAQCLGPEPVPAPVIPRRQQRRVVHYRGQISGWVGKSKVMKFDTHEAAHKWLNENAQTQ